MNAPQTAAELAAVTPRELTLAEVERVLTGLSAQELKPLESLFPDRGVPELAACLSCGVDDPALFLELTHSQLDTLLGKVERANPFLVARVHQLAVLASEAIDGLRQEALITGGQSSSSGGQPAN